MQIKSLNKKFSIVGLLSIVFGCLIIVNYGSSKLLGFARLDLTANKIFTLSAGTKKILANIDEPITLKLFFSKQLAKDNPFFLNFASRVEEFLKLYQRNSNKKVNLQLIDPAPFTPEEDQAVHYGLQGVPVNNEGTELYFGLAGVNSVAGREVIPFLQPSRESYLEYDVSQLIAKLSKQALNKIAVISTLPLDGKNNLLANNPKPWLIFQQMQQQFEVAMLGENTDKIPEDTKVLLLINTGEDLELKTVQAIDKFVLKGGNVLLLVDPNSEVKQNIKLEQTAVDKEKSQNGSAEAAKFPISKLLTAWGIDYDPNKIVASRGLAKQVRYVNQGKEVSGMYPLWIDIDSNGLSKEDLLTSNLNKLTFVSAGAISHNDKASSVFSPLVVIKSDAMLVEQNQFARYKADPLSLFKEYNPQEQPVTLAARVTGELRSAFSKESTKQSNIIIIANADFIYDHFWANVQNFLGNSIFVPTSGNATFILNALDNLTGSNELISIRNKDAYIKGFDKIRELELKSQNKFHQTEEALLKRIEDTKKKLSSMDQRTLSIEHKKEEELFRNDLIETRKSLRDVRRSLREDIQILENKIKFFTIIFMPLVITLSAISYWLLGNKFNHAIGYKKYVQKFK